MSKNSIEKEEIWNRHVVLKEELAKYTHFITGYTYDPNQLVLGWARRLAGYKQLPIIFKDIKRLRSILHNSERPVYLLISGKVHQGDEDGRKMLQNIIKYMQNDLSGQVLFIPNYNLEIAKFMTRGVDVWLNTPEIGREACGTSGMKALCNGVLPCAVADGWSGEIIPETCGGWTIDHLRLSESLYELLEDQIVTSYYERDSLNLPLKWIEKMKTAISFSYQVSTKRMFEEYCQILYSTD